ncbi:MAG: hypothetical protein K2I99_09255, partial [Bacteroidaceae bacterium]|nr:hypothetical protein [Bacteroidaceae bacterium]
DEAVGDSTNDAFLYEGKRGWSLPELREQLPVIKTKQNRKMFGKAAVAKGRRGNGADNGWAEGVTAWFCIKIKSYGSISESRYTILSLNLSP